MKCFFSLDGNVYCREVGRASLAESILSSGFLFPMPQLRYMVDKCGVLIRLVQTPVRDSSRTKTLRQPGFNKICYVSHRKRIGGKNKSVTISVRRLDAYEFQLVFMKSCIFERFWRF